MQKLQERPTTGTSECICEERLELETGSLVMIMDMMSSEESNPDDRNSIIVRSLPWRACLVDEFFEALRCSPVVHLNQSKLVPSTRPHPSTIPNWARNSPEPEQ